MYVDIFVLKTPAPTIRRCYIIYSHSECIPILVVAQWGTNAVKLSTKNIGESSIGLKMLKLQQI